ncbi:hypothetical protein [Prescottella equi]|uniref:hypothetical protein n=1 Tax=Rhodococcus hoagii TaxID=43767 RepID=UPI0027E19532|nr:hypothetical protein [Prescottella equi]
MTHDPDAAFTSTWRETYVHREALFGGNDVVDLHSVRRAFPARVRTRRPLDVQSFSSMTVCSHSECAHERPSEKIGRIAAAQVLNDPALTRVCAHEVDGAVPDYRSPLHAVEVKELASESYEKFGDAYRQSDGVWVVPELTQTWWVSPDMTAASVAIAKHVQTPMMKTLLKNLVPLLAKLEEYGINDLAHLGGWEIANLSGTEGGKGDAPALSSRFVSILGRNPSCRVMGGSDGISHGVVFAPREEFVRPMNLDNTVRNTVQFWLDEASTKMRLSLATEPAHMIRCGVLVARHYGLGGTITSALTRDFPSLEALPTEPLNLPDEIDILVVAAADQAIVYRDHWERHRLTLN